ncbi:pentapeptide repeat-containing protein [Actinoplanes sp. GCM10030250]|uniref:pentapeptide repeat-containing protein n=1 Tax=Actinoplanes sp. GCM10030250 TaxID=3273376 RepID=UPI00361A9C33
MARRDVVARWCTAEGAAKAGEILRRLAGGDTVLDLGWGVVDGLADLRGLPGGGLFTGGAEITGADLSHASLFASHLAGVHWRRCRLDGADLSNTSLTGGSLTECTLRRADLRDLSIDGATWTAADLTGAKARHLTAQRTTFTHTTFPAITRVAFTRCSFDDCRFIGALNDVEFLGRAHDGDPAPAVLRKVTFSRGFRYAAFDSMEFDGVTFPGGDALIVVPYGFRAVADLAGTLSLHRTDGVGKAFRRFLSGETVQRPGLTATAGWAIARRDLGDDELAAFAAGTLARAEAQLRDEGVIP